MSLPPKLLLSLLIALGLGAMGYFMFEKQQTASVQNNLASQGTETEDLHGSREQVHPLYVLAKHHCARLDSQTQQTACLTGIEKAIQHRQFEPIIPEVAPLACNGIADPVKQHECHGWTGHDFAVSTGDITHCDVIPQKSIKASCQQQIVINEIKKLYALENAPGESTP